MSVTHRWRFLKSYLSNPHGVGALTPSSAGLAAALCEPFRKCRQPARVLEVGAGTGAVTRHLGKLLGDQDELDICEVETEFADILEREVLTRSDFAPAMSTGRVRLIRSALPPFFALSGQMYKLAPNMLELNYAPLLGACVINKRTWGRIPAALKPTLLKLAKQTGQIVQANGRNESEQAVKTMTQKWNLKVHSVSPALHAVWRKEMERFYPQIRGGLVPADMFDEVQRLIGEYRSK